MLFFFFSTSTTRENDQSKLKTLKKMEKKGERNQVVRGVIAVARQLYDPIKKEDQQNKKEEERNTHIKTKNESLRGLSSFGSSPIALNFTDILRFFLLVLCARTAQRIPFSHPVIIKSSNH